MIGGGLLLVTVMSSSVLSLPVTSSQLESAEDVKVMKCIVEALADALSRPQPRPVSQECLLILRTDDRLVTILRHHNFLKELQEIAVHGGQGRAEVQRDAAVPDAMTQAPQAADDASDRSMLEALGSTSERSILSHRGKTETGDGGEEKREDSDDIMDEMPVKREDDESPGSRVPEDEWSEGKAEKGEDEEEEEKRAHSEGSSEESVSKKEKGAASEDKRDAPRHKSKEQTSGEENEEEDKRFISGKQEEEEEEEGDMKRGSKESAKQWSKRGKGLRQKMKADRKESQPLGSHQEVPHHSKEAAEEEEEKKKRDTQKSPEEKELQMIAGRTPEERKGSEEEGSASRKSEEPEIESLAAIESELENVAQKLHELRRG